MLSNFSYVKTDNPTIVLILTFDCQQAAVIFTVSGTCINEGHARYSDAFYLIT